MPRPPRPRKWWKPSFATRSGSSPVRLTATASTAWGGYYVGVPVILGASGVERIIILRLTDAERAHSQKKRGCRQRARRNHGPVLDWQLTYSN